MPYKTKYTPVSISFKYLTLVILFAGLLLAAGSVLKNYIAFVPVAAFIYYLLKENTGMYIQFLILWIFISGYFFGQGYITGNMYSMVANSKYYVFLLFIINIKRINSTSKFNKQIGFWLVAYLFTILIRDAIVHNSFGLGILVIPEFIYILFLIQLPKSVLFTNYIYNLLIAVALLQIFVSILQYTGTISPPITKITLMPSKYVTEIGNIESGLDDAAVGTLGSISSNKTSWICTTMFLLLLGIGLVKHSIGLSMFSMVFVLHYAMIDSKTMLVMTILATGILLYRSRKYMKDIRNISVLIALTLFVIILRMLIVQYYEKSFYGIERTEGYVESSMQLVIENFNNWGKITGYQVIYNDLSSQSAINIILGGKTSVFDRASPLSYADNIIMARSNFTNSYSSFIALFAVKGILGILMVLWIYLVIIHNIRSKVYKTRIGLAFSKVATTVLIVTLLSMLIYTGIGFGDITFMYLLIIYGMVERVEREARLGNWICLA